MSPLNFDYDDILAALEDQNCALFIGPGLFVDDKEKPLEEGVWAELDVKNPDNPMIRNFYEEDGLYLFQEENHRRRIVRRIKKYYEQEFPTTDAILQKLARIPFPLVFNISADPLLQRAYDSQLQGQHSDFYFMGQPYKDFVPPTKDRTLIYGMLGDHEEPESMIMTHKDLFSYLESIFQGNSMSPELRKLIQDTDTFVFLGLPFEKWYMQLLLRVLYHISSRLEKIEQYAATPKGSKPNQLFKEEFKIQFLPDNSHIFIEELYKLCEESGQLKPVPEESLGHQHKKILKNALNAFAKNKIIDGIKDLKTVLEAYPEAQMKMNELVFQTGNYQELNKKEVNSLALENDKVALRQTIARLIAMVGETQTLLGL